jgi:TRAP-type C4-dicarboxylate transport system permease small subunit
MSAIPIPYDTSSTLGKFFRALDFILIAAVVLIFSFMVGIVSAQVALRYGLNMSIDWADESGRLAFVWVVFLSIPLAASQGAHIGIDLFVDKFSAYQQRVIRKLTAAICAALCYAIAWSCVELCKDQWDEKMATLDISVAYFFVAVGIGMLYTGMHLTRIALTDPPSKHVGDAE